MNNAQLPEPENFLYDQRRKNRTKEERKKKIEGTDKHLNNNL